MRTAETCEVFGVTGPEYMCESVTNKEESDATVRYPNTSTGNFSDHDKSSYRAREKVELYVW